MAERLRVHLRAEGARHDVLAAVFAAGADDDFVRVLARSAAVAGLLGTDDGTNLLAAYKRAANILRIEDRKDGPHGGEILAPLLLDPAEQELHARLSSVARVQENIAREQFADAMTTLAGLRAPLDKFFEKVTVNDEKPELRRNRLNLLASVRDAMNQVADFGAVEG
jgi:glycyl-tRNA synthetase beta chain